MLNMFSFYHSFPQSIWFSVFSRSYKTSRGEGGRSERKRKRKGERKEERKGETERGHLLLCSFIISISHLQIFSYFLWVISLSSLHAVSDSHSYLVLLP
jgi:hypothetical protein